MSFIDPFSESVGITIFHPTVYVDNGGLPTDEIGGSIGATWGTKWYIYLWFTFLVGENPTGGERYPDFDFTFLRRRTIGEGWLDTDLTFKYDPDVNGDFGVFGVRLDVAALPRVRTREDERDDWTLKRTASGGNGTWTLRTCAFVTGFHHPGARDKEAFGFMPGAPARNLGEFPDQNGGNVGSLI